MRKITNPYQGVNWANQQKANLHCHTIHETIADVLYGSDGLLTAAEVIDAYHAKDYKVLAITNHDTEAHSQVTTWPWTIFGRDPATLEMLAVQGKELSNVNHHNNWFSNVGTWNKNIDSSISAIARAGGIVQINHPGEYDETLQWYLDLCLAHKDVAFAMEVYNHNNQYPDDILLWDKVNAYTIPRGRVVYGYGNDDLHNTTHFGKSYSYILSDTIIEADVKAAMLKGATYFCNEPDGTGDALAPKITNIVVDELAETITITADSGTVKWYTEDTVEAGTGNTFNYSDLDKGFVRAQITNDYGVSNTQPFTFDVDAFDNTVLSTHVKMPYGWVDVEKSYGKTDLGWIESDGILTK